MRKHQKGKEIEGVFTLDQWHEIKACYNYTCQKWKKKEPDIRLEADHVFPTSMGGANTADNIQPLCHMCNTQKGVSFMDYHVTS